MSGNALRREIVGWLALAAMIALALGVPLYAVLLLIAGP